MDRRSFFKGIGVIAAGIAVTPVVVAKVVENIPKPKREGYMNVEWPDLTLSKKTINKLYARYGNGPTVWDAYRLIGKGE